jgi:hypothetical protein
MFDARAISVFTCSQGRSIETPGWKHARSEETRAKNGNDSVAPTHGWKSVDTSMAEDTISIRTDKHRIEFHLAVGYSAQRCGEASPSWRFSRISVPVALDLTKSAGTVWFPSWGAVFYPGLSHIRRPMVPVTQIANVEPIASGVTSAGRGQGKVTLRSSNARITRWSAPPCSVLLSFLTEPRGQDARRGMHQSPQTIRVTPPFVRLRRS